MPHLQRIHDCKRRDFALATLFGAALVGCGRRDEEQKHPGPSEFAALVLSTFETLGSDPQAISAKAQNYRTVKEWRVASIADVAVVGGSACALPLSGLATFPAEFGYLMREIFNSALGIGFITYGSATKDDFATILAHWGDEYVVSSAVLGPVYAASEAAMVAVGKRAEQVAVDEALKILDGKAPGAAAKAAAAEAKRAAVQVPHSVLSSVLAHHSGSKVAGKLGAKVATKVGAKLSGKFAGKAAGSLIPVASGVICGGINWWIMNGILTSAEHYFEVLRAFREDRYKKR